MHGYNFIKEREWMLGRYESGHEDGWFVQLGDGYHCIENAMRYEQMLRCGYSHEEALQFGDAGWIVIPRLQIVRREEVARTADARCVIMTAQLPNGKWVCGYELRYSSGGVLSGPSIYCKAFDSERAAILAELSSLIEGIKETWKKEPKVLLPQLYESRMHYSQMDLFEQ